MFLPVSSDEGQAGTPERLSEMSSSNHSVIRVVSLADGSNCERSRKLGAMRSNVPPDGGANAFTRSVAQESLPAVAGNVQLGTDRGAAAALAGKAIRPTPRAAAEARSNAIRLLL